MSTPSTEPAGTHPQGKNRRTVKMLKELGEVMIPVSLVAIVAQAFSLDGRTTAILSIYLVAVLYTWLYRRWINSVVPPALVLMLFITGLLGFLLFLPVARGSSVGDLSQSGIVGYGEHANDWAIPQVPTYAAAAKHDVWYIGVDFHISASQHQEMILKLLSNGVNVRFLFYDFLGGAQPGKLNPNFPDLVQRFDYQAPQLLADLTSTAENLRKLQGRWKNTPGGAKLEIRLYRGLPWARAYLFDPSYDNGSALLVNYIYRKDTSNLPALLIHNQSGGLLQSYMPGFEALWEDSTDFHDWLAAYDAYKAQNPEAPTPR